MALERGLWCHVGMNAARIAWAGAMLALMPTGWAQEVGDDHAAEMAAGMQLFKESVRPVFVEECL